jgi:hypothetical protein
MAAKVRSRGGLSPKERVRFAGMIALLAVVGVIILQGLLSFRGGDDGGVRLTDPDADTVLPRIDPGPLASVRDGEGTAWVAVRYLLGIVDSRDDVFSLKGRGFARPSAAEVLADPAAFRGRFVAVVGTRRGEERVLRLSADGEIRPEGSGASETAGDLPVHVFEILDADRHVWTVLSPEPAAGPVVKVLGLFLRVGPPAADAPPGEERGPSGPPLEIVAIRTIPSVPVERFERFQPLWLNLVREGTDEEREDLRTPAIWYALAWARTIGPEGLAREIAAHTVTVDRMPTASEISSDHDRLRGQIYRVRGRIVDLRADHALPENPSGLESDYLLTLAHNRGGRQEWQVGVLAPREALPADLGSLRIGEEVVVEGVYLKLWSEADSQGRLVHRPLLVAPRVRLADGAEAEEP